MIISAESMENCREQLETGLKMITTERQQNGQRAFAIVIDGDSLRFALEKPLKALFLQVGVECATVICCRVSPSQKALTVRLVKEGCKAMTLAIGDGANDVAMIQEAHVGVGMFGLEGSQAAMSADYAFGQFRFLPRLLLVHGSLSYKRISDMIMSFFYKTLVWTSVSCGNFRRKSTADIILVLLAASSFSGTKSIIGEYHSR
jgi:phospholipid-translocating ATPase